MKAHLTVITSTVIAHEPGNPRSIAMLEPKEKHGGRPVMVGGRVELHANDGYRSTILKEWDEEAGGKGATLSNVRPWAVATDPNRDIREEDKITLGKLTFKQVPDEVHGIKVIGHYGCPDQIYIAEVNGTPHPNDEEGKRCFFQDIDELSPEDLLGEERFGAGMGVILAVYKHMLDTGDTDLHLALVDFEATRKWFRDGAKKGELINFLQ